MKPNDLFAKNIGSLQILLSEVTEINSENFSKCAEVFAKSLITQNTIFWCGNGGSAAESSHLGTELIGRFKENRIPLSSISLNSDTAAITCIANDFGYDEVYSRQLQGLAKPGDLLVVLSTSGESRNILEVLNRARKIGVTSIALLGKGGGQASTIANYSIVINSLETARIQELHLLIGHTLCEYAEMSLGLC
jgi:D-sedoheptulose 7-phosphate isomerase